MCQRSELNEDDLTRFDELVNGEEAVAVNCTAVRGRTPLMLLCRHNQSDSLDRCIEILLQRPDIDINQTDVFKESALVWLCVNSDSTKIVEMARLLISNGANVNQTNQWGWNALMLICRDSRSDKIVEVAQLLINNDINEEQMDENGRNALMWLCAESKNENIVKVADLLLNAFNIKSIDNQGKTAKKLLEDRSNTDILDGYKFAILDKFEEREGLLP